MSRIYLAKLKINFCENMWFIWGFYKLLLIIMLLLFYIWIINIYHFLISIFIIIVNLDTKIKLKQNRIAYIFKSQISIDINSKSNHYNFYYSKLNHNNNFFIMKLISIFKYIFVLNNMRINIYLWINKFWH